MGAATMTALSFQKGKLWAVGESNGWMVFTMTKAEGQCCHTKLESHGKRPSGVVLTGVVMLRSQL